MLSPSRSSFLISPQPPRSEAKMGRTLLVLLWKHFTVRCRQYINTPLEMFIPVLYFVLLFLAKGMFTSQPDFNPDTQEIVSYPESNSMSKLPKPYIVVYYPQNKFTDELMEKVGQMLGLRHLDNFSGRRTGYYGTNDNNDIRRFFEGRRVAFVSFQNVNGERLPDNLVYTIRMKENFGTDMYKPLNDHIGPNAVFGMQYGEFVRLQWTIDTSYLQLRTGIPVNQTASVQEFPYVMSSGATMMTVLMTVLSLGMYLSLAFVFVSVTIRLAEERASGVQELVKMVGVTTRTLGLSHCINQVPGCLVYAIVGSALLAAGAPPLLENSSGLLVFLMLFLHYLSIVAWAFVASHATDKTQHTSSLAIFIYLVSILPATVTTFQTVPYGVLPLAGFLPGVPAVWFHKELLVLEQYGIGLTFKSMMSSHSARALSVMMVYIYLLIQIALYFMIAWYLSLVRPGQYGTALPWNFLFRREYWSKNEVHPDSEIDDPHEREKISAEPKYFEPIPPGSEVGIEIDNVTKIYDKVAALRSVSLPVLKGEIAILLGHNGAGKTTLMSVITGMTAATSGQVRVNGLDTATQQTAVRNQLGFCPQHNLFFKDLTVLEHVQFFCQLKGMMSWKQSTKASLDLLNQLGLESKANCLSGQLSGGMKRRLQLACALAGDASVLVLDEPTAGLDVETRRSLWDLLLSLRTGRTVLISTHFMEEADALGDRVAALHRGVLRCYATPMHLKKEIDTGYRLSITLQTTAPSTAAADIFSVISSVLPQATQVASSGAGTLAFSLPSRESDKFPELFKRLEDNRDALSIESIGVGVSTLEEVFLKLCSDVSAVLQEDDIDATLQDDIVPRRLTGVKLILSQMASLFVRQVKFARASWKLFLITQVLLPLTMIILVTKLVNEDQAATTQRNGPLAMNLDVYRDMDERKLLSRFDIPLGDRPACCGLRYDHSDNITETLVKIGREDKIKYGKYLIGIELNETNAVAHFTTTVRHALPVAINALTNAIASTLSSDKDVTITTYNHPIDDKSFYSEVKLKEPKSQMNLLFWAYAIAFTVQTSLLQVVALPCKERIARTRHIHIMSGCSPELHWMTSLLYHSTIAVLTLILPTVVCARALDTDWTISHPDVIFPLTLLLAGACLSVISLAFVFSFMMGDKAAATILLAFTFLFNFITPTMKMACKYQPDSCSYEPILTLFAYAVPPHSFA